MSKLIAFLLGAAIFMVIVCPTSYVTVVLVLHESPMRDQLRDVGFWSSMWLAFEYAVPGLIAASLFQWACQSLGKWAKAREDGDDHDPRHSGGQMRERTA